MYTRSQVRIFPEIFLLLNAAKWNKVQSTGFNFCCLMVPVRKAHLTGTNIHPKLFSSLLFSLGEH